MKKQEKYKPKDQRLHLSDVFFLIYVVFFAITMSLVMFL